MIIKTCIAAEPKIYNSLTRETKHRSLCFELYGFDILIDKSLRPWLLEVNVSPSLSSSSPMDRQIKTTLMCDVFNTIGIRPYDRKKYQKEEESRRASKFLGFVPKKSATSVCSTISHFTQDRANDERRAAEGEERERAVDHGQLQRPG